MGEAGRNVVEHAQGDFGVFGQDGAKRAGVAAHGARGVQRFGCLGVSELPEGAEGPELVVRGEEVDGDLAPAGGRSGHQLLDRLDQQRRPRSSASRSSPNDPWPGTSRTERVGGVFVGACAPELAADPTVGLGRLKLATMCELAPTLLITAKTQRWTPEEVLRSLVETEITARDASSAGARLKAVSFPVAKVRKQFDVSVSFIPAPTWAYLTSLEWIGA